PGAEGDTRATSATECGPAATLENVHRTVFPATVAGGLLESWVRPGGNVSLIQAVPRLAAMVLLYQIVNVARCPRYVYGTSATLPKVRSRIARTSIEACADTGASTVP